MKIIITESQYKKITESYFNNEKLINKFQKLIDESLIKIQNLCEDEDGENYYNLPSDEWGIKTCNSAEVITKVKVIDVDVKEESIIIFVDYYYNGIQPYLNIDYIHYELQTFMEHYNTLDKFKLVHNDTINERKNLEW
jgi:hypothetical protein